MEKDIVIIDGIEYSKLDDNIVVDDVSGEFLHLRRSSNIFNFIKKLELVKKSSYNFDVNDGDTWDQYKKVLAFTNKNIDNNLYKEYTIILKYFSSPVFIINTEESFNEMMLNLDLVKGINNPNVYFSKKELSFMDKPQPYRKFDFTYSKRTVQNVIGRELNPDEFRTPDIQQMFKKIIKRNIEKGVESLTFKEFEGNRHTFGIELETCNGRFEDNEVKHLNLKAVHDGSLREADGSNPIGGEYVTGVLTGDSGLSQLHEICRVLQTKCKVDKRCGVHVHIGSLNWSKEDIVYSYILAQKIEYELFLTLPKSRRENSYCRSLKKLIKDSEIKALNTCSSIDEYNVLIDQLHINIFKDVSSGSTDIKNYNKNTNHPKGSKCGFDKNSQRYSWLNYVTLMFDTKGIRNSHTLEFRPMSGTLNYLKIKNWLKLCIAFCSFVDNHKSLIKNSYNIPITLKDLVVSTYPKTGSRLLMYLEERKSIFNTSDETIDYTTDLNIAKKSIKEVVCA